MSAWLHHPSICTQSQCHCIRSQAFGTDVRAASKYSSPDEQITQSHSAQQGILAESAFAKRRSRRV